MLPYRLDRVPRRAITVRVVVAWLQIDSQASGFPPSGLRSSGELEHWDEGCSRGTRMSVPKEVTLFAECDYISCVPQSEM